MTSQDLDLYERFEREIRTPRTRLLLDAFLPAAEDLASAIPPPLPAPAADPEEARGVVQQLRAEDPLPEPEPAPAPPRNRKRPAQEPSKSLQEEIEEFMNRDGAALAPDPDPDP